MNNTGIELRYRGVETKMCGFCCFLHLRINVSHYFYGTWWRLGWVTLLSWTELLIKAYSCRIFWEKVQQKRSLYLHDRCRQGWSYNLLHDLCINVAFNFHTSVIGSLRVVWQISKCKIAISKYKIAIGKKADTKSHIKIRIARNNGVRWQVSTDFMRHSICFAVTSLCLTAK